MSNERQVEMPQVKLVPMQSTWTCPNCRHQNGISAANMDKDETQCTACGQWARPGVRRAEDELTYSDSKVRTMAAVIVSSGLAVDEEKLADYLRINITRIVQADRGVRADLSAPAWLPIESAPKDGTRIDLWANGQRFTNVRWACYDSESVVAFGPKHWHGLPKGYVPTHWMPLPAAPAVEAGTETDYGELGISDEDEAENHVGSMRQFHGNKARKGKK